MAGQPSDWRELRKQKLVDLRKLGLPLQPTRFGPALPAAEARADFDELDGTEVTVAGRLVADNRMGKASFVRLLDRSGVMQLYIKRDAVGDQLWEYYRLLDRGDLVGATGPLFKTKTGEVTVEVQELVLLQKSYQPLPEKFHGLHDVEMRFRQRYLDLIANQSSRDVAVKRSRLTKGIRRFLDGRGFIEVETPILQPLYGGGAATPFMTHADVFDMDLYLRIADELYLKRLIVGGLERVYEIGKDFRNEGFSRKHSQEFTMLEVYQAYVDYSDMMRLLEELCSEMAGDIAGSATVTFGEHSIDFTPPWKRISFHDAMREMASLEIDGAGSDALLHHGRAHHVAVSEELSRGALLDQIFSTMVEPNLIQPTFICDYPIDFPGSTFARGSPSRADVVERFEAFAGGIELANAFTEMIDPFEQEERLAMLSRITGIKHESDIVDTDFITALEYGMPPTGGLGLGIDRLAMILTNSDHVRETILFPLLRRREDQPRVETEC